MTNQLTHLKNHYQKEFDKIRELLKNNPNLSTKELLKRSGLPASMRSRAEIIIEEEMRWTTTHYY